MSIVTIDADVARAKFLKAPFALKHGLADHPLFTLERLVRLAQAMPRDRIEYNSGKLLPGQKPEDIPSIDMAPADVIKRIEEANAWMVIKGVELDPDYAAILASFVDAAQAAAGRKAGDHSDLQGFIFVSSAHSTTPFHVDAEENILVQIRGDKFVHIFENRDRSLVSEEAMEISPSKHRNQHYEPSYEARAEVFAMKEGDAVHLPYLWPHWVRTGGRYSVSMAMTWKTPNVKRLNKIRLMNGTLRHFGLPQKPPGASPAMDVIKVAAHDAMRAVIDPLRRSEGVRRLLRGAVYGRQANYYYGKEEKKAG
ncbi:MAG: cupin-like domain-containing protein [Parvibaculaceae bacterium]